jgi:hypothetical protein
MITISVLSGLVFSGCGGGGSDSTPSTVNISNVGNNINGLGYYSGTTVFGTQPIARNWVLYNYSEDNLVLGFPASGWSFETDDTFKLLSGSGSWITVGYYGVSENGDTLYIDDNTKTHQYNYISMVKVKFADDSAETCTKISNESTNETYVLCDTFYIPEMTLGDLLSGEK